jgi:hypothetical protein
MAAGPYCPATAWVATSAGRKGRMERRSFGAFIADGAGFEDGGGLHGDGGEDLEEVVLDHVAEGAGFLVVGAAAFDADGFGGGDLDVIDVLAIPEGFEDGVAEAEGEDVLDGFFTEVVVDAVELVFGEAFVEGGFEFAGGAVVVAEGFFDDEAAPTAVGAGEGGEAAGDGGVLAGLRREIEENIAAGLALLGDFGEAGGEGGVVVGGGEVAGDAEEAAGEFVPDGFVEVGVFEVFADGGFHFAEGFVGEGGAGGADDGEALGQAPFDGEAVEEGTSLRLVRSPLAPKMTRAQGGPGVRSAGGPETGWHQP